MHQSAGTTRGLQTASLEVICQSIPAPSQQAVAGRGGKSPSATANNSFRIALICLWPSHPLRWHFECDQSQ